VVQAQERQKEGQGTGTHQSVTFRKCGSELCTIQNSGKSSAWQVLATSVSDLNRVESHTSVAMYLWDHVQWCMSGVVAYFTYETGHFLRLRPLYTY
jgi:hypothetical protein